jgi:hypothetical protein
LTDGITLVPAGSDDAHRIAALHVRSWQTAYRGLVPDAFLAGPIENDRHTLWESRLSVPDDARLVLKAVDQNGVMVGFTCVLRDADPAHDRPGLLLVTPTCGLSTPAAFAAFDAGARPGMGAARLASEHLADELRRGLRVADLLARSGVLAGANDLAMAAAVVEPGLVPFKRALMRLLQRPIGLSGSGPTHWAVYPSHAEAAAAADAVRAAIDAGDLPAPGPRPPFVAAARILSSTPGRPADAQRSSG